MSLISTKCHHYLTLLHANTQIIPQNLAIHPVHPELVAPSHVTQADLHLLAHVLRFIIHVKTQLGVHVEHLTTPLQLVLGNILELLLIINSCHSDLTLC